MNKYYHENRSSYFEEPKTIIQEKSPSNPKGAVDSFKNKIVDSRYSVKRPTAKILGYVKK